MDNIFQENKTGLLYATLVGLWLSDVLPTPGDAVYFYYTKKWRDQWSNGELTSKQYWFRQGAGYYLFNSTWWLLVGTAVYFTPGTFKDKMKIGLMLAGTGAVIGVFARNIKKDEEGKLAEINKAKSDQVLTGNVEWQTKFA